MKTTELAQALARTTEGKSKADARQATDAFIQYLKARRLEKLLPGVLREYENIVRRDAVASDALVVARESDAARYRNAAGAGDAREVIDPSIIGGYILETGRQYVDASHRSKLLSLYRRLF